MGETVVKRGDIFFADLSPVVGSEQGGVRPVLILQNDIGNRYSPTTIVCAITSQVFKTRLPIHVELKAEDSSLHRDSIILLEQIRTIDKSRLKERVAHLGPEIMARVNTAIAISLGLTEL
ncbi:MAG: type II toxin-antitoxin system PemK/MazF family toxin [Firmicutes bacterium]|nr:type II toxin-antitoxin system PemK/MazF family toxin [Alicyclobacillaceae bacterium]MCL6497472.1 type II toxin-antitoxin system PemK/MazF family toxin [Bacillota bacterium]